MLLRMFTQQGKEDSYTGFLVGPAALAGSGNINHLQNIQSHSLPYGITLKKANCATVYAGPGMEAGKTFWVQAINSTCS